MVYELHIIQPGILQFSAQFSNFEVNGIYMPCMNNTNKKKYYAIKSFWQDTHLASFGKEYKIPFWAMEDVGQLQDNTHLI